MPEYKIVTEKIERRTYFKGRFAGKFAGLLDERNSDLKIENYYDLEFTETAVSIDQKDFRKWDEDGEFEEFAPLDKFLTRLPETIPADITYQDGSVKHFNLRIHQPKLKNYRLFNQLYEKEALYAAIEGEISGYLKHYDEIERKIEIITPEIKPLPEKPLDLPPNVPKLSPANYSNKTFAEKNRGCVAPSGSWSFSTGGCLSVVAALLILYLSGVAVIRISSALANLLDLSATYFRIIMSVISPLLLIFAVFFIFAKLKPLMSPAATKIFQLIIVFLIVLCWLIR